MLHDELQQKHALSILKFHFSQPAIKERKKRFNIKYSYVSLRHDACDNAL